MIFSFAACSIRGPYDEELSPSVTQGEQQEEATAPDWTFDVAENGERPLETQQKIDAPSTTVLNDLQKADRVYDYLNNELVPLLRKMHDFYSKSSKKSETTYYSDYAEIETETGTTVFFDAPYTFNQLKTAYEKRGEYDEMVSLLPASYSALKLCYSNLMDEIENIYNFIKFIGPVETDKVFDLGETEKRLISFNNQF